MPERVLLPADLARVFEIASVIVVAEFDRLDARGMLPAFGELPGSDAFPSYHAIVDRIPDHRGCIEQPDDNVKRFQ